MFSYFKLFRRAIQTADQYPELPKFRRLRLPYLGKWRAARNVANVVIICLSFYVGSQLGVYKRELAQFDHTYTLHDVRILQRYDDFNFRVQVEDGLPVLLIFCPSYRPQFDSGMTLSLLVYEDTGGCKSIADARLGYVVRRDRETGKAILTDFKED